MAVVKIDSGMAEVLDEAEKLLSEKKVNEAVDVLNRVGTYTVRFYRYTKFETIAPLHGQTLCTLALTYDLSRLKC